MTSLRWPTLLLGSQTLILIVLALFDLFLSSDASICSTMAFPPLGNSDHVVVSVCIDFPTNSRRDAPFYCIAYDYSRADWDGLCDHLRDVPWEDIFKRGASAAASYFCKGFRSEFMYISLTEKITSSLIHIHRFQLLVVLLPYLIEITFFICTKEKNLLILR